MRAGPACCVSEDRAAESSSRTSRPRPELAPAWATASARGGSVGCCSLSALSARASCGRKIAHRSLLPCARCPVGHQDSALAKRANRIRRRRREADCLASPREYQGGPTSPTKKRFRVASFSLRGKARRTCPSSSYFSPAAVPFEATSSLSLTQESPRRISTPSISQLVATLTGIAIHDGGSACEFRRQGPRERW